jgi:hypothetical protein
MTQSTHPVDEHLPTGKLAALGLQHVLVMYAGAVAVPLIVGRALKLSPEQVAMLVCVRLGHPHPVLGRYPMVWHSLARHDGRDLCRRGPHGGHGRF